MLYFIEWKWGRIGMGKTLSFGKGKGNIRHNNREFVTDNVDRDRIADNITYVKQDLHDAYVECFQSAIDEYNARQTRNDRMKSIDGYMDEIKRNQANRNGEKLFYEQVVGIGDMYDSGIISKPEEAEKCKEVLDHYAREFQQRNPNLHVFNMVLHMDEQTPHLHIDYIPRAEGYKQGLQVRNSLSKALENQGLKSARQQKDNNTISWQNRERQHISELCQERGIEIVTVGIEREDMTVGQYKDYMAKADKIAKDIEKQEVKKVNLPFGFKLETPKQAQAIDKELERKTNMRKAEKDYNAAKVKFETEKVKVSDTADSLLLLREQAEKELRDAKYYKEQYQKEYARQKNLNAECEDLKSKIVVKDYELRELQRENSALKSKVTTLDADLQIAQADTVIEVSKATTPLKNEIESLKERLDGMCQSLTNVTKAFNMLKYDKEDGYKLEMNKKQSRLFEAIERYVKGWLKEENKADMVEDIEKHVGISKGIQNEIKALEPSRDLGRGGR